MKTALIVLILLAGAAENVRAAEHLSSYPRVDNVLVRVGDDPRWSSPAMDETGWEEMPWYHINPQKRLVIVIVWQEVWLYFVFREHSTCCVLWCVKDFIRFPHATIFVQQ